MSLIGCGDGRDPPIDFLEIKLLPLLFLLLLLLLVFNPRVGIKTFKVLLVFPLPSHHNCFGNDGQNQANVGGNEDTRENVLASFSLVCYVHFQQQR